MTNTTNIQWQEYGEETWIAYDSDADVSLVITANRSGWYSWSVLAQTFERGNADTLDGAKDAALDCLAGLNR